MIVVCGEALVDLVPDPSTAEGELGPLHPRLGGGPYNVAVALGRLGVAASFLARLSTDQFGDKLVQRLRLSGVDVGLVQRGPEPTTLAVVGLGEDGSARYSFHTDGTAARFVEAPGELPAATEAVSFGTLGMVLEPGATRYETIMREQAARGRLIALDPNIRAALIEDPVAYRERFAGWLPSVGLLTLSVDDAVWLAGSDDPVERADIVDTVRKWQQAGPAAVVLTKGADGLAVVHGDGELVEVDGVRTDVVDTIGAGDTVHAAVLAWLSRNGALTTTGIRGLSGREWARALRFAAASAAVTVSRPGAEPPFAAELA